MPAEFDLFISYRHSDQDIIQRIATGLRERGLNPFLDRWHLRPGRSWPEELERILGECGAVVAFIGPDGFSEWQKREIYCALDRQRAFGAPMVIPALLPGVEEPALGFLQLNMWVDLGRDPPQPRQLDILARAIRGEPPGAPEDVIDPRAEVCPYRGLEPFREEDAGFFFGRASFTAELTRAVGAQSLIAVVGASGSGKSSVVSAGLVPALRRGADGNVWDILTMKPGAEPLEALARAIDPPAEGASLTDARAQVNRVAAMLRDGTVTLRQLTEDRLALQPGTDRLLLVVDQFEELATLTKNEADADRFLDLLLDATGAGGALTVAATLRSDFYSAIVARRDLSDRLTGGVVNIGPVSRAARDGGMSELEEIVRLPAEAAGLRFEDGLVARILADVGAEPGRLPLLEYLLAELWRRRTGGALTHQAYEDLGGVGGAIATRAEEAFSALSPAEQAAAKRLFLSLVRLGEGREATRARAPYPASPDQAAVADAFSAAKLRLLVTGDDPDEGRIVDLGHEALITTWRRLGNWIDQNREALRALSRVRSRQRRWQETGRPDDLLLPSGLELEEGRRLLAAADETPIEDARDFVERSIAADEARAAAERERQEAERRRELSAQVQKRNIFVAAFVVSLAFLAAAAWQWREAADQGARAEAQRQAAVAAREEADAQRTAAESAEEVAQAQTRRAEAEASLAVARNLATIARRTLDENPGETSVAAMIAVDSLARRETLEASAVLRDALSLAPVGATLAPFPWTNARAAVSGDGKVAAFYSHYDASKGPAGVAIRRLDVDFRDLGVHEFGGLVEPVISPDGRLLAGSGRDRRLRVFDMATGETLLDAETRAAAYAAFSPDGAMLYAATQTGEVLRWDVAARRLLPPFSFPTQGARRVRIEAEVVEDGASLLLLDYGHGAFVISTGTGEVTTLPVEANDAADWTQQRHPASALAAPDGRSALIWDNRGEAMLWRLAETSPVWPSAIDGQGWVHREANAFSADGRLLLRGARSGDLVLRDAADGRELARFSHGGEIRAVAFLEAPGRLVSAGEAGVAIWDRGAESPIRTAMTGETVAALAVDPETNTLIAGTDAGDLVRVDPETGEVLARRSFGRKIGALGIDPATGRLAVTLWDGDLVENWTEIVFADREDGRITSRVSWDGGVSMPVLSFDGRLAAGREAATGEALVWETASGEIIQRIPVAGQVVGFSPDGRRLRIDGDALRTIDIATGEASEEMGEAGGVWEIIARPYDPVVITHGETSEGDDRRAWNVETGEELWRIPFRAILSRDGAVYAVRDDAAKEYSVYDRVSGDLTGKVRDPASTFSIAELSPDGERLLLTYFGSAKDGQGQSRNFEIRDVASGAPIWRREPDEAPGPPIGVEQLPNGEVALQVQRYGAETSTMLEVLDTATGAAIWREQWPKAQQLSIEADPDGREVLLSTPDGLELRDIAKGNRIWANEDLWFDKAAFFPDGARVAIAYPLAGGVYRVAIIDRSDGRTLAAWSTGEGLRDLAVSSDMTRVIAAFASDDWDGLRAWDAADGEPATELEMDAAGWALHPLADPNLVLITDAGGGARVFDLRDGAEKTRLAHSIQANRAAFAAEAPLAATAVHSSLRFWDAASGRELASHTAHGPISSLTVSPDGARVAFLTTRARQSASGAEYETLEIWAPGSGEPPEAVPLETVSAVAFDATGRQIAVAGDGGANVRLVDAETLLTKRTFTPLGPGAFSVTGDDWAAFTKDDRHLALTDAANYPAGGGQNRRAASRVFDIETGEEVARFDIASYAGVTAGPDGLYYRGVDKRLRWLGLPQPPLDRVVSAKGVDDVIAPARSSHIVARDYRDGASVIDLTGGPALRLGAAADEGYDTLAIAADPDGRHVAVALREREFTPASTGLVVVYDADSGAELAQSGLPKVVWGLGFADGGETLLASEWRGALISEEDDTGAVFAWRWRDAAAPVAIVDDNPVGDFAISADGSRFATSEGGETEDDRPVGDRQVRVWRPAGGAPLFTLPADLYAPNVALSDDGRRLAIFDAASPTEGDVFELPETGVPKSLLRIERADQAFNARPLGFAEDGEVFILGEKSGARAYDLRTGAARRFHEPETVTAFALSPDGALLAMGGKTFVSVWSLETGERLTRLAAAEVVRLTFAGETGRDLLMLDREGVIDLEWASADLTALACRVFAADQWTDGRRRLVGASDEPTCEPARLAR